MAAWITWVVGPGQFLGYLQVCGAVDKKADAMQELAWGFAVDGCQRFEDSRRLGNKVGCCTG